MRFVRGSYKPGKDKLVYGAVNPGTTAVVVRVYGPRHNAKGKDVTEYALYSLEPGVFALDFNFSEIGNYIFVIEEDGDVKTILNAKVYA